MDITSFILGRIKGSGGAGALKYLVVDELPTVGEDATIYLVPKTASKTNNYYDEYMYINSAWELIGDTQIDLTDYIKNTDYASTTNVGIIKASSNYATYTNATNGVLIAETKNYSNYESGQNGMFISKGTLENVIEGKGLVTQYSTLPTASADNLGKIAQYTGTTTQDYTNGYFYQVISDGEDPATYSWENIEVQDGGGKKYIISNTSSEGNININNPTNIAMFKDIALNFENIDADSVIMAIGSPTISYYAVLSKLSRYVYNKGNEINIEMTFIQTSNNTTTSSYGIGKNITNSYAISYYYTVSTDTISINKSNVKQYYCIDNDYNILGMSNTTAWTPTGDYNPATKKYVDDSIASAITTALQGNY